MPLSRADAAAFLAEAQQAEHRSAKLRGYQSASPHLIIWGAVWAVGYTATYLAPAWANLSWLILVVAGIIGDVLADRADAKPGLPAATMIGLGATFAVLVVGTIAVMAPHDPRQIGAFIPLVVAAGYAIIGTLGAARLLAIAAAMAILTLGGFFTLGDLFLPWMAAVGGGGLLLGGLWLRHA